MSYLFIINEQPYGNEKPYNALRLAYTLQKEQKVDVNIFLMGDSVICATVGQNTPDGYYNMESMLKAIVQHKGNVYLCGTCMDARGMSESTIVKNAKRSTMSELAILTTEAEKVLVF